MPEKNTPAAKTASEPGGAKGFQRQTPPPVALGLASSLLDLQRTAGNRHTGRLLGGALLQPKLRIGPPGDAFEREADRVADAVLRGDGPAPISIAGGSAGVQRMCAQCEEEMLQRKCHCQEEEDLLQPKADGAARSAPGLEARIDSLKGSGRPLSNDLRSFFEPRFGHDFSDVRVHTGARASEAAQAVRARAFTVGDDVVFGNGEWSPETHAGKSLLAHELTHVVQQTPLARRKPLLQRAPQQAGEAAPQTEPEPESPAPSPEPSPEPSAPGEPTTEAAPASQTPAAAVVTEDDSTEVGKGQMTKSGFLARLRTEVCAAAEAALAGTEHSAEGCPFIDFWFSYYEGQSAERINRDLSRFVTAEPAPTTAAGYIAVIVQRVSASVTVWARTGQITGVPPGVPLPGMNLPGVQGAAAAASWGAGVFFKSLPGSPRNPGSPHALRARLGAGQPLDGGLRSRMESAFGRSFGHVRVHTDGHAAGLSDRLNARAFAVGEHVAFGSQQYRPGTLVGDALIAHELAHVAQQEPARETMARARGGTGAAYEALERDADGAALGAVTSLWGGMRGSLGSPLPRLRSPLRLSRCDRTSTPAAAACKPAFKSLEAKKTGNIVMTTAWRTVCEMAFGEPSKVGVQFKSEVDVPAGCTGTLEYLQLVDTCRQRTDAAGSSERQKSTGFALDTSDPYASKKVTSSGSVKFDSEDSPGTPTSSYVFRAVDEKFRMWLLWTPDSPKGASRVPLAMAEWFWKAKTKKTGTGSGCAADWTISDDSAGGGVGSVTTTMPKWSEEAGAIPFKKGTC